MAREESGPEAQQSIQTTRRYQLPPVERKESEEQETCACERGIPEQLSGLAMRLSIPAFQTSGRTS
eukprot:759921-Hanusia_phi.AAC.5